MKDFTNKLESKLDLLEKIKKISWGYGKMGKIGRNKGR